MPSAVRGTERFPFQTSRYSGNESESMTIRIGVDMDPKPAEPETTGEGGTSAGDKRLRGAPRW